MSVKKLSVFALALVIVGLGSGAWLRAKSRAPASQASDTSIKSRLFRGQTFKMAKPNQVIDVSVDPVGGFPAEDGQEATLRATITLQREVEGDINYQWTLPPGVELVSGETDDVIPGLHAGQTVTRDISVLGFSSEGRPRNITIDVNARVQGAPVSTTGLVASHPTRRDLMIGFRKSKEQVEKENSAQSKVTGEAEDSSPPSRELPKGVKL